MSQRMALVVRRGSHVHQTFQTGLAQIEPVMMVMVMNVENWFKSPNTFDFNDWGGDIMQKQDAMHLACKNGWDVFTLERVLDDK